MRPHARVSASTLRTSSRPRMAQILCPLHTPLAADPTSQPKAYETEVCGTTSYMAPEVIKGRYQTECDMWSLGVMVYFMLSGALPFKGRNDAEKEAKIQAGSFSFSAPAWGSVSDDGKDFVKQLLNQDPTKRLTGKQVRGRACKGHTGSIAVGASGKTSP
eukprot:6626175-Prymnesium_polylepis.1